MRGEAPTLAPLERANLNDRTTHFRFTTGISIPETRLCRREITGKYAIKIVIKQAHSWNVDREEGRNLWIERDEVSETLCFLLFRIPDDGQSPKTP
jgi:hypothetical protein